MAWQVCTYQQCQNVFQFNFLASLKKKTNKFTSPSLKMIIHKQEVTCFTYHMIGSGDTILANKTSHYRFKININF